MHGSFWYGYNDKIIYLFFVLPALFLAIFVQLRLQLIYNKFSKVYNFKGLTGAIVARNILDGAGLFNVRIESVAGSLTDHFDPTTNVVRLSAKNYSSSSIAAVGVAAHEVGHAIQFAQNYVPMRLRSKAVLVTRFGSFLYLPVFVLGLVLAKVKLMWLGVFLFSFMVFFELITLPVEFDASFRAMKILRTQQILNVDELSGVKKVLWAAAMTYIASFINTIVQLIRFILIVLSNTRNDD